MHAPRTLPRVTILPDQTPNPEHAGEVARARNWFKPPRPRDLKCKNCGEEIEPMLALFDQPGLCRRCLEERVREYRAKPAPMITKAGQAAAQEAADLKVLADCGIEADAPEGFIHVDGAQYGQTASSIDLIAFTDRSLAVVVRCGGKALAARVSEAAADAIADWFGPEDTT